MSQYTFSIRFGTLLPSLRSRRNWNSKFICPIYLLFVVKSLPLFLLIFCRVISLLTLTKRTINSPWSTKNDTNFISIVLFCISRWLLGCVALLWGEEDKDVRERDRFSIERKSSALGSPMSPVTTDNDKKTLYQAPILWIACKGWDVYKSNRNLSEGNTSSTQ